MLKINSLQNVDFGFFLFYELMEWRRFVTYLWNDPHTFIPISMNSLQTVWKLHQICRSIQKFLKQDLPEKKTIYSIYTVRHKRTRYLVENFIVLCS